MDEPMVAAVRGDYESSDLLSERHKVALRLVDAFIIGFGHVPEELARTAHEYFNDAELSDIGLKVLGSSTNKVSVALATDDEDGVEERLGIRIIEDYYKDLLWEPQP
jgi:hypothetical protein